MKRRISGLIQAWCLLAMAVGPATAVDEGPSRRQEADRRAIRGVLEAQQAAWNEGDVAGFMRGYWRSPELTFAGSSGFTRGWDAVLARYKTSYQDRGRMGRLDFSDLEFRSLGPDGALVLGKWHLTRASGDVGGVFSLVWQRFAEGWRIVHDHTSVVTELSVK